MKENLLQPFHLVTLRPWPILISFNLFNIIVRIVYWFHFLVKLFFFFNFFFLLFCLYQWWRDVIRESTIQGYHNNLVIEGLKLGIILFIISELLFFIRFFWCYFHVFLGSSVDVGNIWPPKGIKSFNPYFIPLLNTIILLSSGVTVTISHNLILINNYKCSKFLLITCLLGLIFTLFQLYEYIDAIFCLSDSVYGSIFFMGTGFHGFHVIIGSLFLFINYLRINSDFSIIHHFGFEASAWYWHFVDVVWLYLFLVIYYWSS